MFSAGAQYVKMFVTFVFLSCTFNSLFTSRKEVAFEKGQLLFSQSEQFKKLSKTSDFLEKSPFFLTWRQANSDMKRK